VIGYGGHGNGRGLVLGRDTQVIHQGGPGQGPDFLLVPGGWGGVFAINQLITIITNRPPDIAMALLILSTATVWGTNGDIIRRYFKIRGVLQPQSASQTAQTSAKSNLADGTTLVKPTATTFRAASTPEPLATSLHKDADKPPASALSKCPACGARLFEGDAFCMKCGGKL